MKAQLCKTNLMRLGGGAAKAILDACKAAGVEVERRDCLVRCQQCNVAAIAVIDGMPVGAPTGEELAEQIAGLQP